MALKDFWQQQRQQRQQAATQRRQQVSETLAIAQKERQELASELRSDLSLFRITLASADRDRTIEFQHFSVKLQQHRVERQRETQEFLTNVSDRRHSQAQQVASQLREFVQALQVQTADFLAVTEVERSAMAQQLADDLQTFRVVLDERVNALRQDIRADLQDLQLETQAVLSQSRQQRLKVQIRLTRNLAAFTESLRFEVQNYLSDVKTARHDRAASLAQSLHQNRTDREAKNGVLFSRLADFRSHLTSTIWGEDNSSKIESEVSEPVALQPSPVLKNPPTRLETLPTVPKISLSRPLAKVNNRGNSEVIERKTDDLRTSPNFEARSLQAILRRSNHYLFRNGVRSQAKATGETQTRSSCQTELRRPSAADVAILARVPHLLPHCPRLEYQ